MRRGGQYIVEKEGAKPKRVEGTEPDKRGDRPRDAKGVALNGRENLPAIAGPGSPEAPAASAKTAKSGKEG